MTDQDGPRIRVQPDGPYRVMGATLRRMRPVVDANGDRIAWDRDPELDHDATYDLCRCGASRTMPFCDGSELEEGFDGTETALHTAYADRAFAMGDGPVVLTDDPSLCAGAAFCEAVDTDVWTLAENTNDPEARSRLIAMVRRCPSGRLALLFAEATGFDEEELPQEIGVVDNGPLWVRGAIGIEAADGSAYEVRNRMTLCRCGGSRNKPFCDGTHRRLHFRDPS
jgi:CDGSH-type Zn-finger protein